MFIIKTKNDTTMLKYVQLILKNTNKISNRIRSSNLKPHP